MDGEAHIYRVADKSQVSCSELERPLICPKVLLKYDLGSFQSQEITLGSFFYGFSIDFFPPFRCQWRFVRKCFFASTTWVFDEGHLEVTLVFFEAKETIFWQLE